MRTKITAILSSLSLLICFAYAPNVSAAEDWNWTLAPYLWASDTSLDVYVNDNNIIGGELDFSDLLDKLDAAFLIHFEGQRGRGGFFLDYIYMSLSDSTTVPPGVVQPGADVDAGIDLGVLEAAAFFRPSGGENGLDILLGVRSIDAELDLTITPPDPDPSERLKGSETFTDGFLGLRYGAPLGEKWFAILRGDVGSGDTELTWTASALFGRHFGENGQHNVLFGYRYMAIELEDTSENVTVATDIVMSGPILGYAHRW